MEREKHTPILVWKPRAPPFLVTPFYMHWKDQSRKPLDLRFEILCSHDDPAFHQLAKWVYVKFGERVLGAVVDRGQRRARRSGPSTLYSF